MPLIKDDMLETSNVYSERVNEKMTFFHPGLDLSGLDISKSFVAAN